MLLVIHNLPLHIGVQDIKSLVRSRCGVEEIILDKLVRQNNNSQSMTIGVNTDREADAVMHNLNGHFIDRHHIRVEDMRIKNKPAVRSAEKPNYTANNPYQNRGQIPDKYGNNQQTFRAPEPVNNPYWSNFNQVAPPPPPSQMYTGFGRGNAGTSFGSQNTYMDYANQQQQGQREPQFESSHGGQNMGWNEGSQFRPPSLIEQDSGAAPGRFVDNRRDREYGSFHKDDRKRHRSPDHGGYNENRWPSSDNRREHANYERKEHSEKYDPEESFRKEHNNDNRNDARGLSKYQSGRFGSQGGAEHSNPAQSYPKAEGSAGQNYPIPERSSYGGRASGSQSEVHGDSNKKSRWGKTPQEACNTERNSQSSNRQWNETPHRSNDTEPYVPPSKLFKVDNRFPKAVPKTTAPQDVDSNTVFKAISWRNEAVVQIAKKIVRGRLHYKINNKRFQTSLAAMKHIIKIQVEELIKIAYPHESFALVAVDDIIQLYRNKFTKKDDDDLFAKIYVVSEKANTAALTKKIEASNKLASRHYREPRAEAAPVRSKAGKKQKKPKAPKIKKNFTPNRQNAPDDMNPSFTPNSPNTHSMRPSYTPNRPNAPGIRPSFTATRPNAPGIRPSFTPTRFASKASTNTPSQNQSFKQNPPKASTAPPAKSNEPDPDRLPQYINGDKKQSVRQKQVVKQEFIGSTDAYKCSPDLEKALRIELKELCNQYTLACETTVENEKQAAQLIRDRSLPEFKQTIRLHVVKRLLDIKTNLMARIFAHGKPPRRNDIENALKSFGVIALKKSNKQKLMYVATCDSYANFDKLCNTKGIDLTVNGEAVVLSAKPFQMTIPFKFRRQMNKQQKSKEEDSDDGIYEEDNSDDEDVQVIETLDENILDSIVIHDTSGEIIESKPEEVEKSQDKDVKSEEKHEIEDNLPKGNAVEDDPGNNLPKGNTVDVEGDPGNDLPKGNTADVEDDPGNDLPKGNTVDVEDDPGNDLPKGNTAAVNDDPGNNLQKGEDDDAGEYDVDINEDDLEDY